MDAAWARAVAHMDQVEAEADTEAGAEMVGVTEADAMAEVRRMMAALER
jgi:hypothetical protein